VRVEGGGEQVECEFRQERVPFGERSLQPLVPEIARGVDGRRPAAAEFTLELAGAAKPSL
jgi:hypothetical protein